MNRVSLFQPERRNGLIFQAGVILFLVLFSVGGVWLSSRAVTWPVFLAWLLPALVSTGLTPVLSYRTYALQTAYYALERDGLRLRWGLRLEEIPMDHILWVVKSEDYRGRLPQPWLFWPGAVLGKRRLAGTGFVEYLSSRNDRLVLVGTREGSIFAISPVDREAFLQSYRRLAELGSISPLAARSVQPSFLLVRVWRVRTARALILSGLGLNLLMILGVLLMAPGRGQVVLGFIPGAEAVPAVRLLLLPFISSVFYLVDLLSGLFFYRREEGQGSPAGQPYAYILWGSGSVTPALFLAAIFFILQNS